MEELWCRMVPQLRYLPRQMFMAQNYEVRYERTMSLVFRINTTNEWWLLQRHGYGLDSNPEEGMDVCKFTVPSRHAGTQNSRRVVRPLVRRVEGEDMKEALDPPQGVQLLN
ncbi:hypothetical protein TNCV_1596271 [Trichonephila clavipes]|nr:hypothetical protein TNCV_1596271 [Trichonephila clavipes]